MFAVPFDEIAPIVDRSPEAARQLASRARRRVQGRATVPDADVEASARSSTPSSPRRARATSTRWSRCWTRTSCCEPTSVPGRGGLREVRGAAAVAGQARMYSRLGLHMQPALVNGAAGAVTTRDGKPFSVGAFTVSGGKIVEIDFLADPERLAELDLTILDD